MSIDLLPLTPERLEDVEKLLLPIWNRQWDRSRADRILRWRFLERPDWEAIIAYDGARPVGFVDSFLRHYRNGSSVVRVREPADWYAHPDYRPILSVQLLRRLMGRPEPIVTVGGKENSVAVLPRMGWQELPEVAIYVRIMGAGSIAKGLSKRFRFPLSALPRGLGRSLSVPLPRLRRTAGSPWRVSTREIEAGELLPEVRGSPGTYALSPILSDAEVAWYRGAPEEIGRFIWLAFETPWNTAGISCSRLYEDGPFVAARLLHLDASVPSVPFYAHMIAETVRFLRRSRPQWIGARFSCRMARRALEKAGFMEVASCRAHWWPGEETVPSGPLHLSWASGDEPLLPYPY